MPASSGKTRRHHLNRGGDRRTNSALHKAVISRLRIDEQTTANVARRTAEGHSKLEIIRCLKRHLAREAFFLLKRTSTGWHPGSWLDKPESIRGTRYTSLVFGQRLREAGIVASTGSTGDSYHNAMAESFFASLETVLLDRMSFRSRSDARLAVFDYIEGFFNPLRRHWALGYLSPVDFESKCPPEERIP